MVIVLNSCSQTSKESTGSEYMPDMAHSIAYEANYYNYYYNNTWGTEEEYYKYATPKKPVVGTVPRGSSDNVSIPKAVSVAEYPYADTEEGRTRAMNELVNNPLDITEIGLAQGKELYGVYCGICHGDKGDGGGYLVRDDGGVYPVQPANFLTDEFVSASNGRYYHSIIYGRNLMGNYRGKLNYEERWQVIHYIRSLQAKDKDLAYNQLENTLNNIDRPAGGINSSMIGMFEEEEGNGAGDNEGNEVGAVGQSQDNGAEDPAQVPVVKDAGDTKKLEDMEEEEQEDNQKDH